MYHDYIFEELEKQAAERANSATVDESSGDSEDDCDPDENNDTGPWPHSKIRFEMKDNQVIEVKSRDMLSSTECRAIWYQTHDFSKISSLNRSTIKIMRRYGSLENEPDHCLRGLESKLASESDRIKDVKVNSIYAVLKEQSRQRKEKVHDPKKIAKVYREHVFSNVAEAQERGAKDERDTKNSDFSIERRKLSSVAFDDFDLNELQKLNIDDDMKRFEQRVSEVSSHTRVDAELNTGKKKKKKSKLKRLGKWMKPRSKSIKAAQWSNSVRSSKRTDSTLPTGTRNETEMSHLVKRNGDRTNPQSAPQLLSSTDGMRGQYSGEMTGATRPRRQRRRRMSM